MSFFSFLSQKKPPQNLPPLLLHNTLSGELEQFVPLNHTVRMYNCGPTAYAEQHIGNLFPPVVANILSRTLGVWGYQTQEVNNITDFGHISDDEDSEDKMTLGLRREGMQPTLANMRALAEKYAELFLKDLPLLGIDPARVAYPRASDYIPEQIALVKSLEQKGYAYRTKDGVYFDTARFPGYGKLGRVNLGGQQAGARVEIHPEKRAPYDFALWKLDKKLGWESPWGLGFPGWHTECVAMIFKLLGKQIDIHMGGADLIPVHHNNEIAQAEALSGKQFVRYWLHNAHITIEGKKISKSLGNTIYLHNLIDRGLSPRALRYWFLTGHYRTPSNFTWDAIEGAHTALARLTHLYFELPGGIRDEIFLKNFYAAIAEDLNTAKALALVWESGKAFNQATLAEADKILGLGFSEKREVSKLAVVEESELPKVVQGLLQEREEAREQKDFEKADSLRAKIEEHGFEIKDTPEGPKLSPTSPPINIQQEFL